MPTSEVPLVHRQAVRALILTADHEVLLCRIHTPGGGPSFWIAPGGGLEPGETVDEGLRRELLEELGLTEFEAGPVIWRRHHTFDWGDRRIWHKWNQWDERCDWIYRSYWQSRCARQHRPNWSIWN